MQARWGTHGDHSIIVLSPSSVTETYKLTVEAFNLAEKYRTPVILLLDEVIGHMREKVDLKELNGLRVIDRKRSNCDKNSYRAYEYTDDLVPPMEDIGTGYKFHVTGLSHDSTGFPTNSLDETKRLLTRLSKKIDNNLDDIIMYDEFYTDDCEELIVTFGFSVRSSKDSIEELRKKGVKAGLLAIKTVWPFPEKRVKELSKRVGHIFVPEMNMGQMILEVERVVKNNCEVIGINKFNGDIITPQDITSCIEEVYSYAK
jgi:2-oxoglutarate ferredoxin oxidoreductase subunit alpha